MQPLLTIMESTHMEATLQRRPIRMEARKTMQANRSNGLYSTIQEFIPSSRKCHP